MDAKTLQKEIKNLENELNDLKTIQGVIPSMQGYSYNYMHSGSGQEQLNVVLELEYADGDGPIFSTILGSDFLVPLDIIGNKQKFYGRLVYTNSIITFYSNRQILSVTKIS